MNVKNILIINDFNYIQGGASKVAIDTAQLLKKMGYNIYFFYAVNKEEDKIDGIHYISTSQMEALKEKNKFKGFCQGIYNLRAQKMLKKLLLSLDKHNTIIFVHGWTKALSSSVFKICFDMDFKVILTTHDYFSLCPNGGFFNYKSNKICNLSPLSLKCIFCNCDSRNYLFKLYRILRLIIQNKYVKLLNNIKYVICISELNKNIISNGFLKQIVIKKIYNPIEFDLTTKNIDFKNNNYFLFVGRVSKEKGIDDFCKVVDELSLNGIVVGDGPEKSRLESRFKNIKFVGWKSEKDVKQYIKHAKALIFPSLWYEGAPLTPLESLSLGIPVIMSKCSSATEYLNGWGEKLIYSNYKELKQCIKYVDNVKCIKFDSKNYSSSNYILEIEKFLKEI